MAGMAHFMLALAGVFVFIGGIQLTLRQGIEGEGIEKMATADSETPQTSPGGAAE